MSFARDVKKELITIPLSFDPLKAQLYGLLQFGSERIISNRKMQIQFKTTSLSMSRFIISTLKKLYQINVELSMKSRDKLDYKRLYYILIEEKAEDILKDLYLMDEFYQKIDEVNTDILAGDQCVNAYLRGAFLAKGSINDPHKPNYHLEIVAYAKEQADYIYKVLDELNLEPKVILRAKGYVIYLKKAESISDFLRFIGAYNSLFYFEDARIKRDLNNSINRIINCDMANSSRTLESAMRQLEDIKVVEEYIGYERLSPRLMEAVLLRTQNPESSLQELSEISEEEVNRKISKSALNHCFRDLQELAKPFKK